MSKGDDSPIEGYLDAVLAHATGDPRTVRRILDEAGDHLRSSADAFESAGLSHMDAERAAVDRFGAARQVTGPVRRVALAGLAREIVRAAILLGACGLIAIGISGALAAVMNALWGQRFVGGVSILGTSGAGVAETAQDAVVLRGLSGAVGVAVLTLCVLARKRPARTAVLPRGLVDTLGAAAFAGAFLVLGAASTEQATTPTGSAGVGWFLSGAVVALGAAVVFGLRAVRALLTPVRAGP